jgi:hypothetical protein
MALLAFNLSSLLRLELEAAHGGSWDLVRFRDCVLKAGGRIVKHGNRLVVKLAKAVSAFWSTASDKSVVAHSAHIHRDTAALGGKGAVCAGLPESHSVAASSVRLHNPTTRSANNLGS